MVNKRIRLCPHCESKPSTNKVQSLGKRKHRRIQIVPVDTAITDLVSGDEPSLEYWKELAETRRQALEESLQENEYLHKRVEELQGDNQVLEELLEGAKQLAEVICKEGVSSSKPKKARIK